jgi:hypothetical protein
VNLLRTEANTEQKGEPAMTTIGATTLEKPVKGLFDRQLERVCWALFLIMIGALALLPEGLVPAGTWLVGTGLIMVGLNVVRHFKGIRVSGFTTVLGLIALALGFSAVAGVDLPVFAILLAAIGLQILYSVLVRKGETR